jgi:hypothetical protein
LRRHFDDVAVAVAAAQAARSARAGRLSVQGHVLVTADLLATFAVEFGLHHLDLLAEHADRPGPVAASVDMAARTLDGLLGADRPSWWDEVTYIKKATGREPLDADDQDRLGGLVSRLPLFG